jgi:hypothetical protein
MQCQKINKKLIQVKALASNPMYSKYFDMIQIKAEQATNP